MLNFPGIARRKARGGPLCASAFILCWFLLLLASLVSVGCAPPQAAAFNPTPIPTLIPATAVPNQIEVTPTPARVVESFPAGIPSAEAGRTLYGEHCAACHGVDGEGQVPNARDFGDVDYMRGETPLDFYVAVTEGVPSIEEVEYEMPAFGDELSSDERWDLVYYVWRFSTTQQRLAAGQEIYTSFCQECHGRDGRSQVLNAADLSDQRFMARHAPSSLYLSVTRGRGSMPAFQARLSQDERWMVIDYLRTFTYDPHLVQETVAEEAPTSPAGETVAEAPACEPAVLAQTNPFAGDDAAAAAGEPIYLEDCAGCHGDDGTGAVPQVGDFTNPAFQGMLEATPGTYLCIVREGINRMPSFKEDLADEEIWQVLSFIASLDE